ncbi:hypothetical protein GCM10010177_75320 [Actinomadura citrea]|nr:hypothetical protein GCM10010177_75320 [Actinomadura citrea]
MFNRAKPSHQASRPPQVPGASPNSSDRSAEGPDPHTRPRTASAHVFPASPASRLDQDAVRAALTSDYHNGETEGVNTKTKLIKRQMYGRAGFRLLRHRILLG